MKKNPKHQKRSLSIPKKQKDPQPTPHFPTYTKEEKGSFSELLFGSHTPSIQITSNEEFSEGYVKYISICKECKTTSTHKLENKHVFGKNIVSVVCKECGNEYEIRPSPFIMQFNEHDTLEKILEKMGK